jgi:hypothetical protein
LSKGNSHKEIKIDETPANKDFTFNLYSSPHPLPPERTLLALSSYRQGKKTQSAKKRTRKRKT